MSQFNHWWHDVQFEFFSRKMISLVQRIIFSGSPKKWTVFSINFSIFSPKFAPIPYPPRVWKILSYIPYTIFTTFPAWFSIYCIRNSIITSKFFFSYRDFILQTNSRCWTNWNYNNRFKTSAEPENNMFPHIIWNIRILENVDILLMEGLLKCWQGLPDMGKGVSKITEKVLTYFMDDP